MHAITKRDDIDEFSKTIGKAARHQLSDKVVDGHTGFIHHPNDFPIKCRRVLNCRRGEHTPTERGNLGLCFESLRPIESGNIVELSVRLRGESQRFCGRVVLVRGISCGYEIGVWMASMADAARLRIVEQICHIECYLREKRERERQTITRENATQKWISRFTDTFPIF